MKTSALLIFFFINSYSRGNSLQDYSTFIDEDFKDDLFYYEPEADNITTEETSRQEKEEADVQLTTINFANDQITSTVKNDEGNVTDDVILERENAGLELSNREHKISSSLAESLGKRIYLGDISHIHRRNSKQENVNFDNEKVNFFQALKRREAGNDEWPMESEVAAPADGMETFPLNDELYYGSESKQPQIEYLDYSSSQEGNNDREFNNTANKTLAYAEGYGQNILQKNYYYNYYPLVREKPKGQKWTNDNQNVFGEHNRRLKKPAPRKYVGKNSCKQYLEFLKFAFEKLDESPEYEYREDDEDYDYEYEVQDRNNFKKPVFKTQLYGPSLYIDNSGKGLYADPEGRTYQTFQPQTTVDSKSRARFQQPPSFITELPFSRQTENFASSTINLLTTEQTFQPTNMITTLSPNTRLPEIFDFTVIDAEKRKRIKNTQKTTFPTMDDRKVTTPSYPTEPDSDSKLLGDFLRKFSNVTTTTPSSLITFNPVFEEEDDYEAEGGQTEAPDCNDKMLPCPVTYNLTYPLNGYCNRYVSCESGVAIRRTCPEGLHFNLITRSCDLPHNSICAYACPAKDGYYGIPGDCGGYFKCKNSIAEYRMCPPKMHWNFQTEICTFPQLSTCQMKCSEKNEIKPYEGDCQAYIICLQGLAYYHKCPVNTNFDPKVMTCIPQHLSKCQNDPKLLTKHLNPNQLCGEVNAKMASQFPCNAAKKQKKENYIMQH